MSVTKTNWLNLKWPTFVHKKMLLQINFIYLGSKEMHCILRHAA